MTLRELSPAYRASAELLAQRIRELQRSARATDDPVEKWHLRRRIAELRPMLRQSRSLAQLTRHYYDRGYRRNDTYRI